MKAIYDREATQEQLLVAANHMVASAQLAAELFSETTEYISAALGINVSQRFLVVLSEVTGHEVNRGWLEGGTGFIDSVRFEAGGLWFTCQGDIFDVRAATAFAIGLDQEIDRSLVSPQAQVALDAAIDGRSLLEAA